MKYLKETSEYYIKLQKLEDLMNELNISIKANYDLYICIDGHRFQVFDLDNESQVDMFPRTIDNYVISVVE
jgi:hypothetical protein